jgi:hypothetical protein
MAGNPRALTVDDDGALDLQGNRIWVNKDESSAERIESKSNEIPVLFTHMRFPCLDLRRAPDGQSMPLCQDACAGCHTARVTPFSAPPLGQPRAGLFSDDRRWSAGCLSCWPRAMTAARGGGRIRSM